MKYTITVNRAGIGQVKDGIPVPCVRIHEDGVPEDRYCNEVLITGTVRIGPIRGRLIAAETDGPVKEIQWQEGSPQNSWLV